MAIRYSGDTEIRVGWDRKRRAYRGTVRDPRLRWEGEWTPLVMFGTRTSSEAYDQAAKNLLRLAQRWAESKPRRRFKSDGTKLSRIFQAPCPTRA